MCMYSGYLYTQAEKIFSRDIRPNPIWNTHAIWQGAEKNTKLCGNLWGKNVEKCIDYAELILDYAEISTVKNNRYTSYGFYLPHLNITCQRGGQYRMVN